MLVALIALAGRADEPKLVTKPGAFPALVNPNCSHCVDEAKRRANELRSDDPVLVWTRGYSDGGAIPIRFFLAKHRVISDSYGTFVYDPDAGFARGFAPSYHFTFHGWRNGIAVLKDNSDGTLYSALSGVAFDGPKKGARLKSVPTITSTWGEVMERYPNAVAYHMFEKYKAEEVPTKPNSESVKSRPAKPDPRLKPEELVLGVRVGDKTKAYPLSKLAGLMRNDELGGTKFFVTNNLGALSGVAAYTFVAHQPRKWKAPHPNKDGVSPPDVGAPLPDGKELPPKTLKGFGENNGVLFDFDTSTGWDAAGRGVAGILKGWTLEPVESVVCKWFAWSAEYPETEVFDAKKPDPDDELGAAAGSAEVLRLLPKPWATFKGYDAKTNTVSLLLDGEKVPKAWPLEPDAEVKVNGYWGRASQFASGARVWVWLRLDRAKTATSVVMLADEHSEKHIHAKFKFDEPEPKFDAQVSHMRALWAREGLPGTVSVSHVFSGEVEVLIDHEGMRWARGLSRGDTVSVSANPPIKAVVKAAAPWRERTQLRLVVGELAASELRAGARVAVKVPTPEAGVETAEYPPDIGRARTRDERIEWFLASTYCVCPVAKDTCTGHFYTLASCNPYGCGAPNAARKQIGKLLDAGKSDKDIWDALRAERGALMTRPHLLP